MTTLNSDMKSDFYKFNRIIVIDGLKLKINHISPKFKRSISRRRFLGILGPLLNKANHLTVIDR